MSNDQWCVLSLQRFPKELRRRLKIKAAEREVDLQDLCMEYLEAALSKDDSDKPRGPGRK